MGEGLRRGALFAVLMEAAGVGRGPAAFLMAALDPGVVRPYRFTAPPKSATAYRHSQSYVQRMYIRE